MVSKEIKDYIKNNLPTCNNKIELAYAIYVLLGQILYYSPIYATTKNKKLVLPSYRVTVKNPYVICYTWSEIYNSLLNEYGISSYIDDRNKEHSLVTMEIDGIEITADATKSSNCSVFDISNDLTSIKFGLDINFFCLNPVQEDFQNKKEKFINSKQNINKKLNIDTETDKEIENYIKMLDECEIDLEERTILLLNMLNNLYKKNNGEVERRQLFDRYYKRIFKDENFNNRQFSILYPGYTMAKKLVIVDAEEIMYYLEDEKGFRVSSKEEIEYLLRKNIIKFKYPNDFFTYLESSEKKSSHLKIMI